MKVISLISTGLLFGAATLALTETAAQAGCNFHGCSQVPGVECNFHGCPNPPNGGSCTFHGCPPATPVQQQQQPQSPVVVPIPYPYYPGVYPQQQQPQIQQQTQIQPRESLSDCIIKLKNDASRRGISLTMAEARQLCIAN